MKNLAFLTLIVLQVNFLLGQSRVPVPSPAGFRINDQVSLFVKTWSADCDSRGEKVFRQFAGQIRNCGIDFPFQVTTGKPSPNLLLRYTGKKSVTGDESYGISINSGNAVIEASSDAGMFYGLQTLAQLTEANKTGNGAQLPGMEISDQPGYGWRGMMLDESRHFFGKEIVKQLLDWMAFYKLNRFHWHLTDVPGWRLEIRKYPLLTTVGGIGNHSDPKAPAQYYTQEEIREIVQYAADRYIEVIPEIDMPGHARAANRAYPEFSGGGSERYPDFTFNPGNEKTYGYLTDILREVAQLFPSRYIHLGGDEVHFGNEQWKTDKYVQALMEKHKLKTLQEVEFHFIKRMTDSLSVMNKTMIGWDEIVTAGISPEKSRVMWWRHDKPEQLTKALKQGYPVILCPRIPLYFDFVQDSSHVSGRRWKGDFASLDKILGFNRLYDKYLLENPALVAGIQANLWTETIHSPERLDYMTYPRIAALSEIAWTHKEMPDYEEFLQQLQPSLALYKKMGISFFNPENPEQTPEIKGPVPLLPVE